MKLKNLSSIAMIIAIISLSLIPASGKLRATVVSEECGGVPAAWFPFLGDENLLTGSFTTKLGIHVQTRGFEISHDGFKRYQAMQYTKPGNEKIKKGDTERYFKEKGASHLITPFREFGRKIIDDGKLSESFIAKTIDQAALNAKADWDRCPEGKPIADGFDFRTLTIELRAKPWCVDTHAVKVWAVGMNTAGGRYIASVIVGASKIQGDPTHAYLRNFKDIVQYEVRNSFATIAGLKWDGIPEHEPGHPNPCEDGQHLMAMTREDILSYEHEEGDEVLHGILTITP